MTARVYAVQVDRRKMDAVCKTLRRAGVTIHRVMEHRFRRKHRRTRHKVYWGSVDYLPGYLFVSIERPNDWEIMRDCPFWIDPVRFGSRVPFPVSAQLQAELQNLGEGFCLDTELPLAIPPRFKRKGSNHDIPELARFHSAVFTDAGIGSGGP